MAQSNFDTKQIATATYLQALELYRELQIAGVGFKAYEPGYGNFAETVAVLSRALNGEEFAYTPTPLERELRRHLMSVFCHEEQFPLEKFIDDPFQLKLHQLSSRFTGCLNARSFSALSAIWV